MNPHSHFLGVLTRVKDVLTNAETGECALEPAVCRAGVYPAGEVPLDACGSDCAGAEGMLWVNLQPTASPNANVSDRCQRLILSGQIGVARCSAPAGRDGLPDVGAIEANAVQQALDADTIANAVVCCGEIADADLLVLSLSSWTPVDNGGTCYGGYWTVTGTYDLCCT